MSLTSGGGLGHIPSTALQPEVGMRPAPLRWRRGGLLSHLVGAMRTEAGEGDMCPASQPVVQRPALG